MRLIGLVLALGLTLASLAAQAQQAGKVWRVGVLEPGESNARAHLVEALSQRPRDLGYEEGRNVAIELRFANGRLESLPAMGRPRPGGNITGRTTQAPELMGKRIQLLKEPVPRRGVRLR